MRLFIATKPAGLYSTFLNPEEMLTLCLRLPEGDLALSTLPINGHDTHRERGYKWGWGGGLDKSGEKSWREEYKECNGREKDYEKVRKVRMKGRELRCRFKRDINRRGGNAKGNEREEQSKRKEKVVRRPT